MTDWRGIDTAPHDGTLIRLKRGDWEAEGLWHVNGWCADTNMKHIKIAFNTEHQPTHWAPL